MTGASRLDPSRCAGSACTRAIDNRVRPTFPSRVPIFALDRVYTRRMHCRLTHVPRGPAWARMSDHLPLVAELEVV
jgi:endonuclease/exonuclease/phosphatase family metal-dependent hydrolase